MLLFCSIAPQYPNPITVAGAPRFEFPSERDPQKEPQHRLYRLVALRRKTSRRKSAEFLRTRRPDIAVGNLQDFGYSSGCGGVVAFSRVLSYAEVLVIANTNKLEPNLGVVLQDFDLTAIRAKRCIIGSLT